MPHAAKTLAVASILAAAGSVSADTIVTPDSVRLEFNALAAGTVITDQFVGDGVTIRAVNPNRPFDLAILFDSNNPTGGDADLGGTDWNGGNIASGTDLGNLLILSERNVGNTPGVVDVPDDEGRRPAGTIFFDLNFRSTSLDFDLVDLELASGALSSIDFYQGGSGSGLIVASLALEDLYEMSNGSVFFDPTIETGDNSANSISGITAELLEVTHWDAVAFNLGGSAGLDNVQFGRAVPLPGTAMLGASAMAGLAGVRRRRIV